MQAYNAPDQSVTDKYFYLRRHCDAFYMGLKPNFNTTPTIYPGMCVPSFVLLLLRVGKILRGRKWGQKYGRVRCLPDDKNYSSSGPKMPFDVARTTKILRDVT